MDMYEVTCLDRNRCGFKVSRFHANINTQCTNCGGNEMKITFGDKVIRDDSNKLGNGEVKQL